MNVLTIVMIVVVFGGVFVYYKFFAVKAGGKFNEAYTAAQEEFRNNRDKIREEYFSDENRFKIIKDVIPDEEILGMASYVEPASIGKSALKGIKTQMTGIKKVNVCHYYIVATEKHLHFLKCNGETTNSHEVFSLDKMKNVQGGKPGSVSAKDRLAGVDGSLARFAFDYDDGKTYSYNLHQTITGYPKFEPYKSQNQVHIRYFAPLGYESASVMKSKEGQVDLMFREDLYRGFKDTVAKNCGIVYP